MFLSVLRIKFSDLTSIKVSVRLSESWGMSVILLLYSTTTAIRISTAVSYVYYTPCSPIQLYIHFLHTKL